MTEWDAARAMLTRIPRPQNGRRQVLSDAEMDRQVGDSWAWDWAIPLMYRALHAPNVGSTMPSAPTRNTDLFDSLGYWNALHHMLSFSLGWTRHDRGLRAWYDAGKPTDDPRLALLAQVWDADGLLDAYIAWAHDHVDAVAHVHDAHVLAEGDALTLAWTERLRHWRSAEHGPANPAGKHLESGHWGWPKQQPDHEVRWVADRAARRAALVLERPAGFMRALSTHGNQLPQHQDRAWRVDVVVESIGFLGTYRRSWSTGIWFSGPHRFHAIGN